MLQQIDKRKVAIYFVLPMAVMSALLAMCFSGVRILETIVVMPHLESVARSSRRELGLLENLQNVLILITLIVAVRSVIRLRVPMARIMFIAIATVSLFMLLEETDYGLHFYEFLSGTPQDQLADVRNLHNRGISTPLKSTGDVLLILGFVVAPLVLGRSTHPWIRYLAPHRYFILTMLCAYITSRVGHSLEDNAARIGFEKNIGEFREAVTYYIAMLYTLEISRRTPPPAVEANGAEVPPATP
jgi:hypothetical protein